MSIVLTQNNLEIVKKKWKTEGLYRDKSLESIWAYIETYFTLIKLMNPFVSASRSVARWKLAGWLVTVLTGLYVESTQSRV